MVGPSPAQPQQCAHEEMLTHCGILSSSVPSPSSHSVYPIEGSRHGDVRIGRPIHMIPAVGNLHAFLGPDHFNEYRYPHARLYWTGFPGEHR